MTLTIRQIAERCKTRHMGKHAFCTTCVWCGKEYPCPDKLDAVAALKALDKAERACSRDSYARRKSA